MDKIVQGFRYLLLSAICALNQQKELISYCTRCFDDNEVDAKRIDGQPHVSCARVQAIDNACSN